jgi:hypothetical protein
MSLKDSFLVKKVVQRTKRVIFPQNELENLLLRFFRKKWIAGDAATEG